MTSRFPTAQDLKRIVESRGGGGPTKEDKSTTPAAAAPAAVPTAPSLPKVEPENQPVPQLQKPESDDTRGTIFRPQW